MHLWETAGGTTLNFIPSSTYSSNMRALQYFKLKCLMQIPPDMERKTTFSVFMGPLRQGKMIFKLQHVSVRLHGNNRIFQRAPGSTTGHRVFPGHSPMLCTSCPVHLLQLLPQSNQARGHRNSARSFGHLKGGGA